MAGRRYSAGRIFLDVIPSFRGVIKEVREEADDLRKALEKDNEKAAAQDEQKQAAARKKEAVKGEREKGKAVLTEAERAWRNMTRAERREDAKRERDRRRSERLEGQRSLDAATDRLEKLGKLRKDALKQEIKERRKHETRIAKLTQDRYVKLGQDLWTQVQKDEKARQLERAKMAKEAADAEARLTRERLAREEEAQREIVRMERKARAERLAADKADQKKFDSLFAAQLREREKEMARSARVQGGRFGQEMRKALGNALKDLDEVKLEADTSGAMAEVAALRSAMESLRSKRIGVDIDGKSALAEMRVLEAQARRLDRRGIDIHVRTNAKGVTAILREQIGVMRAAGRASADLGDRHRNNRDESRDAANAFRLFNFWILAGVTAIPMLVPAIAGLAGALGSLIPLALGAGAGIGALIFGMTGLAPAVQALGDVQDNAAKDALAHGKAMRNASRAIRDAQQGVARAEQGAAEAAEDAARRVADARRNVTDATQRGAEQVQRALRRVKDAEDSLADAQRAAADAQRDLVDARAAAQDQLEDLAMRAAGGALAERQARLDLERAKAEYQAIMSDGSASRQEKEQGSIDYERAQLQLKQAIADNERLAEEQKEAAKSGVEGSDVVVAAKERVADATRQEADAEAELAEARQGVAQAQTEAAQMVADAQRDVADAIRDQQRVQRDNAQSILDAQERLGDAQAAYQEALTKTGDIGSASMQKLEQAMGALGPEGRAFAEYLHSLREPLAALRRDVQRGLLPGVMEFMQDMGRAYGPAFRDWMIEIGVVLGNVFRRMSEVFQDDTMRAFFGTMDQYAGTFTTQFAEIIFNLLELVGGLATAFAPFGVDFGNALIRMTEGWAEWAASLTESEGFYRFMDYSQRVGREVVDMFVALGEALVNLGVGLAPYGEMLVLWATNFFDAVADMDPDLLGKIAAALVTFVVGLQLASGAMALFSGANMFFAKNAAGGFANPLALVVLAATALVGIGAILANEFEWFADAMRVAGDWAKRLAGFLWEHRAIVALVVGGLAVFIGILMTVSKVILGVRGAMLLLNGGMRVFGVLSLASVGWIAVIIVALAALVAGVIYAWRNHEGFREGVLAVWDAIMGVVSYVADWFVSDAIPSLARAWQWFVGVLQWAWKNVGAPIWRELVRVGSWAASLFVNQILPVIGYAFEALWGIVKLIFMWIGRTFSNAVDDWRENSGWMKDALQVLWDFIVAFYEDGVRPMFQAMGDIIVWWWDKVIKPIFRKVADAIDTMVAAFESGESLISSIWAGIVEGISGPVNVVIRWINEKMIGNLNKLMADIGLSWKIPKIPEVNVPFYARREKGAQSRGGGGRAGGGTVRGAFATGGVMDVLPGYSPGVDNHLFTSPIGTVALSGGEGILRPEVVAVLGPEWVHQMNAAAMAAGQGGVRSLGGYATGGVVDFDRLPRNKTQAARELEKPPKGMSLWELFTTIKEIIANPVKGIKGFIDDLLDYMPGRDSFGGRWLGGAMLKMGGTIGEKVKDFFTAPPSSGGAGGRPTRDMAWPAIWAMVKQVAPEAIMTSNFRSGARTAGFGNTSLHALGRAIDIVSPNMATTFMKILRGMPWPNELIHTPMGGLQISRGGRQTGNFPAITRAQHLDHIHLGYDRGGIFPALAALSGGGNTPIDQMVNLYDRGGVIENGMLGLNLSGAPEAVLTNAEWQMIQELANGRGGESVTYAPQITAINGASADEVLDEAGWRVGQLERQHASGRGR